MSLAVSPYRVPRTGDSVFPSVIDAVNSIAGAVHEAQNFDGVLRAVAHAFAASTGVSRCSLRLPDPASNVYRLALSLGKSDYTALGQRVIDGTDAFAKEVLDRRAPVIIDDTRGDPRLSPLVRAANALGAYSMIGVPIIFGEKTVALAFLDSEFEQVSYSPWQVEAARQLGALCGASLVTASMLVDRGEALRRARQENETLRRMSRLDSFLEKLTSEGLSPSLYARNAARLLGRPVTVYDRTWTRMGAADVGGQVGAPHVDLGDRAVRSHRKIEAELELVRRGQTRILGPLPAIGMHTRCIVAPVVLGAENWGVLVVHEAGRTLQPFEAEASARVGARFGAALAAANSEATTVAALRSAVARDLVHGGTDEAELAGRAHAAGFGPDTAHMLVLFDSPSTTVLRPEVEERLTQLVGSVLGAATVVPSVEGGGLAILSAASADAAKLACVLNERLGEDPMLDEVSAVISSPFPEPSGAKEAYVECRHAMRCVHRFRHPGFPRAARVREFGAALPFMASVNVDEARAYARRQLRGLDGAVGEDDLITTLRVFVDSFNVRRCARVLGVHENTVRYRLSRIEKLTGLDLLNDASGQLRAELTVSAMRLVGDLPWEFPGTT
ncbi:helix-turn-helix domain-containing protein [Nocardia sp. NPDC005745]|uniref:helix-turn-helix domain-containing protein n=1 Tax=Nocardia sp. NPDC005745 TaxID=3157061 RepID=UPI0033D025AC